MPSGMLEKIRACDNLPSLPVVAVEVLKLVRSEDASAAEIARVIEHDPALASKLLKVANSAMFGMPRQICSVQQAMVVLGTRTVKVMALTFSLAEAVQGNERADFDYQTFWRRSLTSAVAGRLLAKQTRQAHPDEVFVMALLSDIGMLAAFHADPEAYRAVLAECEAGLQPIHVVEYKHFGATHSAFSSHLLDTWGLPEVMIAAIARHHQDPPEMLATGVPVDAATRCVAAAAMIGDLFCSPGGAGELPRISAQIPPLLGISDADLQQTLHVLQKQVQEAASVWAIDIGKARSYKDIQAEAVVQMAKLTMAAELERAQLAVREQELHSQNRTLARKAATDGLTGIANRVALEEHLAEACSTLIPEGRSVGMLLMDLDRFKKLNDTFGHQAGDNALRLMGDCLRGLDDERCLTARYGGEEFALVLLDATQDELRDLAEEIRLRVQRMRIPVKEREIGITVSIGVGLIHRSCGEATPAGLIARADRCLYQAKETGRNRVSCGEARTASEAPSAESRPRLRSAHVALPTLAR